MDLGTIGVWSGALRNSERAAIADATAELEELGYGTIWFPGGGREGLPDLIRAILQRTRNTRVATGIVNIWTHPAAEVAAWHHAITEEFPGRFLLGIGVSHQHAIERAGLSYERPIGKLLSYLDELDSAEKPVPIEQRIIAALGPRALGIARDRSLGTHPYFVPVEHTRLAREAIGPGKLLAPEIMVVVETDPSRARKIARASMDRYLNAPNYVNNLLRLGYTEAELANGGSDRVVDTIVAWGEPSRIMQRVREHHAAGADHVCIQVLTETPGDLTAAMACWRQLAPALKA
jgi:probable F420-dependent oxidoreductase